jgi:hypothetical protein
MRYSIAEAVTRSKPVYVLRSDSNAKKNCLLGIEEIPMTEEKARRVVKELNKVFRTLK